MNAAPTPGQLALLEQLRRDAYPRLTVEERDALRAVLVYARLGVESERLRAALDVARATCVDLGLNDTLAEIDRLCGGNAHA